jgi:hypothetical protein
LQSQCCPPSAQLASASTTASNRVIRLNLPQMIFKA